MGTRGVSSSAATQRWTWGEKVMEVMRRWMRYEKGREQQGKVGKRHLWPALREKIKSQRGKEEADEENEENDNSLGW